MDGSTVQYHIIHVPVSTSYYTAGYLFVVATDHAATMMIMLPIVNSTQRTCPIRSPTECYINLILYDAEAHRKNTKSTWDTTMLSVMKFPATRKTKHVQ